MLMAEAALLRVDGSRDMTSINRSVEREHERGVLLRSEIPRDKTDIGAV